MTVASSNNHLDSTVCQRQSLLLITTYSSQNTRKKLLKWFPRVEGKQWETCCYRHLLDLRFLKWLKFTVRQKKMLRKRWFNLFFPHSMRKMGPWRYHNHSVMLKILPTISLLELDPKETSQKWKIIVCKTTQALLKRETSWSRTHHPPVHECLSKVEYINETLSQDFCMKEYKTVHLWKLRQMEWVK